MANRTGNIDVGKREGTRAGLGAGPATPAVRFQQVSHISLSMAYDLIDKLRYYEKETLKLPEPEIEERMPHMRRFLERLRAAYLEFAEVDF